MLLKRTKTTILARNVIWEALSFHYWLKILSNDYHYIKIFILFRVNDTNRRATVNRIYPSANRPVKN